jgi:hypothetical protein
MINVIPARFEPNFYTRMSDFEGLQYNAIIFRRDTKLNTFTRAIQGQKLDFSCF